jgi:methanogenic corrinoid protein MtbC1
MSEEDFRLSTQRAAQLLHVHESSIKRWCNADALACSYTPGGHRRIALSTLLDFAREQSLPCTLLVLHPHEEEVWEGVNRAWSGQDYRILMGLTYDYLYAGNEVLPEDLVRFLLGLGFSPSALFDHLLSPVLSRIGDGWQAGTLAVGDEQRMTECIRDLLYSLLLAPVDQSVDWPKNGEARPVAIVGCGRTDSHDLGAMMVRLLLAERGWRVIYLGRRVPTEDIAFQQQQHRAALVCVSFSPPQDVPDVISLLHTLARLFDPQKPYRLALGGNGVRGGRGIPRQAPFVDLQCFENTEAFVHWIDEFSP